jgi:hypothetical protein
MWHWYGVLLHLERLGITNIECSDITDNADFNLNLVSWRLGTVSFS